MEEICEKSKCCGCFLCKEVCPRKAISITSDESGFLYPEINQDLCINCNLCKSKCPINCEFYENTNQWLAWGGYCTDNKQVISSTSGAAAYCLAKKILESGNGVVYGAGWSGDFSYAEYKRIQNINDFDQLRGTKYVDTQKDFYKQLKSDLSASKNCFVIGCPCTIAAVKSFLESNYPNLILCELICHGVTSNKYLNEFVKNFSVDNQVKNLNLRYKQNGIWEPYFTEIETKEAKNISPFNSSYFGFAFNKISRLSCYCCPFKGKKSQADLQIGDFWGAENYPEIYNKNGTSSIVSKTEKGTFFLKKVQDLKLAQISLEFLVNKQPYIFGTINLAKRDYKLEKNCIKYGLISACKRNKDYKIIKLKERIIKVKRRLKNVFARILKHEK